MNRTISRLGIPLALCASLILVLPGCGSGPEEYWQPETQIEEEPLEETRYEETLQAGTLKLRLTQRTRVTKTPVERLTLYHEDTYADFDWDDAGLVFFSVLGGLVSIGLYFLFAFYVFDTTDEETNK